jgi:CBS domain-containing protein
MRAKDIMHRRVHTVRPETRLRELLRLFESHGITGAPVVGPGGDLIGMISRSDLLREQCRAGLGRSTEGPICVPDMTVEAAMTPWTVSFEEDVPVEEIARQMLAKGIHRVAVTREGTLCGIISSTDMTRALLAVLTGRERPERDKEAGS